MLILEIAAGVLLALLAYRFVTRTEPGAWMLASAVWLVIAVVLGLVAWGVWSVYPNVFRVAGRALAFAVMGGLAGVALGALRAPAGARDGMADHPADPR